MFTRLVNDNINYKSLHLAVARPFLLFSCGFQGGDYIIVFISEENCYLQYYHLVCKILLSDLWSFDFFQFQDTLLIC